MPQNTRCLGMGIRRLLVLLLLSVAACLAGCALLNSPPVAIIDVTPVRGDAPLRVTCGSSRSYHPFGSAIVTYHWDSGDGRTSKRSSCAFVYEKPGTYTIRLTVADGYGASSSASKVVTVLSPPDPSSLAPVPFPVTSDGFWSFVRYCHEHWHYEKDEPGELVQSPETTFFRMRGDCDDFAVMIAGYAQAYWPYDSFVAALKSATEGYHAVAFIRCDVSVMEWFYAGCGPFPYYTLDGKTYMPIDQSECIWWHWRGYGCEYEYEFQWQKEWDWWVGQPLSLRFPSPR